MSWLELYDHQREAVDRLKNGNILCGGVGSGKSRTALAYYYVQNGGELDSDEYIPMDDIGIKNLYIITTAQKRDRREWEAEMAHFLLSTNPEINLYRNTVVVDSWNNIQKYANVQNAFFIFDEDRVVGYGVWAKTFIKIAKANSWILLSATPGDRWIDYMPVFIANGFYRNKTDFDSQHVVWDWRQPKYQRVERYLGIGRLIRLRKKILVDMDFSRKTISIHKDVIVEYDRALYKAICKERWNIWEDRPIKNASEFCHALRRAVNQSEDRQRALLDIFQDHPRLIVFYNFDYELDILKSLDYGENVEVAEWNGHRHQPIPENGSWVYLVQYIAGAEGWNCILTDTIVFYSMNYSYRTLVQASGRIDRLNTPFDRLYYYHLKSRAGIDLAIAAANREKKQFNEMRFAERGYVEKASIS